MGHGVVSPLETKRSRGDAGEKVEEARNKRSRDRDRVDPPEGNQDGDDENHKGNPEERMPDDPEPEEFINPESPTTPPLPTTAEWIEHQIAHIPFKPWCPICVKMQQQIIHTEQHITPGV